MEEMVSNTIHGDDTKDEVLAKLIEIAVVSETENRPLYIDFFREEPVFYRRHFRGWIRDGIKEVQKIQALSDKNSSLLK